MADTTQSPPPAQAAQPSDEQIESILRLVRMHGAVVSARGNSGETYRAVEAALRAALSPPGVLVEPAGPFSDMDAVHEGFKQTGAAQGLPVNRAFLYGARWARMRLAPEPNPSHALFTVAAPGVPLGVTEEPAPDAYLTSTLRAEPVAADDGSGGTTLRCDHVGKWTDGDPSYCRSCGIRAQGSCQG